MSTILDTLRKTIKTSGLTQYRIAKDTGIPQSALSRLMSGERGLSVESIEQLCDYLGLEIVLRPTPKAAKRKD